ncbi:MAG: oligosaccharide flippase family protein, partial [Clostridia bacterium]|nr:oligosaccharide flippase family protein [Clostridia bacterium]
MKQRLKLPARAGIYYGISAVLGRGAGLLFTPLFTRLLSGTEYGIYSHFLNWLAIFTIPATLELCGSTFMRMLQKDKSRRDELFSSAFLVIFCACATVFILYFTFYRFLNGITELGVFFALMVFLEIIANGAINLYLCASKFSYRYKSVFAINLLSTLPPLVLSLILIRIFGAYGALRVIAQVALSVILAAVLLIITFKDSFKPTARAMRELTSSALPFLPHYVFLALVGRLDKLIIGSKSTALLARYTVATTLGSLISFALGALFSALIPWILRKLSAKREDMLCALNGSIIYILVYLSLILLCFAPELLRLLAPPEYAEAIPAVIPTAITVLPYFIFTINMTGITHSGKGISSSFPSLCGLIVMTLGVLLLRDFSYLALAWASLAAYVTMALTSTVLQKKRTSVSL